MEDIENITKSLSPIPSNDSDVSTELEDFVNELISTNSDDIDEIHKKLRRKYQLQPSKKDIHNVYKKNFSNTKITPKMRRWMVKKQMRSNSGVLVVTIVLAPNKFSCKYDCAYCPQETDKEGNPTQPRSYLSNEPAMLRALESNFSVKGQFNSRISSYTITGNIVANQSSKIEVIFSGGTWESYPKEYREQVIRELYWSANTVSNERESKTLEEEITINETAQHRIIGFTLETRPDNVTEESITNKQNIAYPTFSMELINLITKITTLYPNSKLTIDLITCDNSNSQYDIIENALSISIRYSTICRYNSILLEL